MNVFQLPESELIEFAKSVELIATKVLSGLHRSPRGGHGIEFHSARPYAEGEDIRHLNWKRYAATDRYFVNCFEHEAQTGWTLLLDRSPSMNYGQKNLCSRLWVGSLIFLAHTWGDRWWLAPQEEFSLDHALELLAKNEGGLPSLFELEEPISKRDRCVVISDFFFDLTQWKKKVDYLRPYFSSMVFLQILDPRELQFHFSDVIEFRDMESSERLVLDSKLIQKVYLKNLESHQAELNKCMEEGDVFYVINSEEKLEKQLLYFFEQLS